MHREYRILNVVLSKDTSDNPVVTSDIAVFNVDKEKEINKFVKIHEQVNSLYPYTQELLKFHSSDVVILDDIKFNGKLKTLLLKNQHMLISLIDYKYKNYVYVVCKVGIDSYLVYLGNGKKEIVSYSDLVMYDELGRLFNAKLVESGNKKSVNHLVVCGVNNSSTKKYSKGVEVRELDNIGDYEGDKGKFALSVVNLRNNPYVKDIKVSNGHLDSFVIENYDDYIDFSLPTIMGDLLKDKRPYQFIGNFHCLDLSSVRSLNKNSLLIKGDIDNLVISDEMALSSNLDFLVYSLREFTGDMNYKINELLIQGEIGDRHLDLAIDLIAELFFNTDFSHCSYSDFPIQHIILRGEYTNSLRENEDERAYETWINNGLIRFSNKLLENYNKALGYCKRVLNKSGKTMHDCSVQVLELLSNYEKDLLYELKFFELAVYVFFDYGKYSEYVDDYNFSVYNQLVELITKNQEERTNATRDDVQEFLDSMLKKLD